MKEDYNNKNSMSPIEVDMFRTELGGMITITHILYELCKDRAEIWNRGEINYKRYPGSVNL